MLNFQLEESNPVMTLKRILLSLILLAILVAAATADDEQPKNFRIGFFEGGKTPTHALLRHEFRRVLEQTAPADFRVIFTPVGFKSALWNRDTCRTMAAELAASQGVDLIVCFGPWVVEDLLAAGCDKPIIAMHRFDPIAEGLVSNGGRPIAENLTVHIKPGKIETDLATLADLVPVKKVGVLFFPSADEHAVIFSRLEKIARQLGFEVVTADEYNNYGTYAFFKAYNQLKRSDIDAVYLGPMWGMDAIKTGDFLDRTTDQKVPVFTYEGNTPVKNGAIASNGTLAFVSDAHFNAMKAVRIMQGELPADLPVIFGERPVLVVNEEAARACNVDLPRQLLYTGDIISAPPPENAPVMTLPEAIGRALAQNPGYLAQYDALETAAAAAREATTQYLPQVDLDVSVFHLSDNAVNNSHDWLDQSGYASTIRLQQTIFSLESIREIQAAGHRRKIQQIEQDKARRDLEYGVTVAYLNCLQTQQRYQIEQQNREHIDLYMEVARLRYLLDDADSLDIVRWESEWHNGTARVIDAFYNVKIARVMLNVLLNVPTDYLFALDTGYFSDNKMLQQYRRLYEFSSTADQQLQLQNYLVGVATSENPNARSFNAMVDLQKTLVSKNRSGFFPTIGFQAAFTYADRLADDPPWFAEEKDSWSLLGFLRIPIFSGGKRLRAADRLKATLSQTEFLRDSVSLEIMGRISRDLNEVLSYSDRMPPAYRAQGTARTVLEPNVRGYEFGTAELTNLLDAQTNALSAELRLITSRFGYYLSLARLVNDIGWTTHEHNNTFDSEFFRHLDEYAASKQP